MAATTANGLPLAETDEERAARLAMMADQYGDDLLTDEEYAEIEPVRAAGPAGFYDNLADELTENELSRIAQDVVEWADRDEESRKEWYDREVRGMAMMGLIDDPKWVAPFKGATEAVHPLLAEAVTNFQARAIAEMWPAQGPVKTVVMGLKDDAVQAQADRVKNFMNYQYTSVNGGFDEEDRMLMRLPMSGSTFKKRYYDPQSGIVRSDYVEAADFLVPYQATSLQTAVRYTHRMLNVLGNDIRKLMKAGWYRDVDRMLTPGGEGIDNTEVHDAIDQAEGREPIDYEENGGYTLLEMACYLNLDSITDGEDDDIALPYVVTVEKENQAVLSIRRGWKENDPKRERRVQVTHYKFMPGMGFYGYGFVHVIGGLAQAATGALRAFLDGAGLSNMRGGFKSRDAKLDTNNPLGMGEWRDTDMTAEELQKCFYPMDYREPSSAMFQILGYLDDLGRRYSSTTETLVGDANNNGPVGTTLALIEQGLKVFSAIHKRLHEAHADEFRGMADLYSEVLPEEYPYRMQEEEQTVLRSDFDDRVDVLPVSDPNVVSSTQRIAQAQGVVELSGQAPDLYDMRQVHRRMLSAMQVQNIDELLPAQEEAQPADPVTEGADMFTGKGVQAFPEQDHLAHMTVHMIWWEQMVPEDMRKDLEPIYKAHQAEHLAELYKLQALQGLPPELAQDPQQQDMLAQQAAQVTQLMAPDSIGLSEQPKTGGKAPPDPAETAAQIQREDAKTQAQIERDDAKAMADIERDNAKAAATIERDALRDLQQAEKESADVLAQLDAIENQNE